MSLVKAKMWFDACCNGALGMVILIEAVMFVLPSAAHDFARTHMPGFVRLVLGFGEIAGCILLLIPQTAIRGAWLLLAVFVMAILLHLLHGMYGSGQSGDLCGGGVRDCGGQRKLRTAHSGCRCPSPPLRLRSGRLRQLSPHSVTTMTDAQLIQHF